jgi:hypothetical protein
MRRGKVMTLARIDPVRMDSLAVAPDVPETDALITKPLGPSVDGYKFEEGPQLPKACRISIPGPGGKEL